MQRTSAARRLISEEKEGKGHLLFDYRNQRACKELRGECRSPFSDRQCPKNKKKRNKRKKYIWWYI